MIRREESDSMWLIHQAAHAYVAGQLAEHWVGNGSMPITPREEVILAAYAHDSGWAAAEQAPSINRYGQPSTFTEMGLEEHITIWNRSVETVFAQNRYAALLVSLHCTALYEQRLRYVDDPPAQKTRIREFVADRHAWEQRLIAALAPHPRYGLAVQPAQLALNLRLLQVWDYLSLLVCMGPVFEQTLEDVPLEAEERAILRVAANGPRGLAIDPYPLDQPLSVWIDARPIVEGPFGSVEAFRERLAEMAYKPLMFEFEPLSGANGRSAQGFRSR
ncbi:MAG: DUF3891 family protein [Chloroflexi bacterium]|nr:DUF3891 family protein [Chloroflexota bacterium]